MGTGYHFTSRYSHSKNNNNFKIVDVYRFPLSNPSIFSKWVDFVKQTDISTGKAKKTKKITKYSSICCRHFLPSDFSQSQSRKFLKKNAVPSVRLRPNCSSINNERLRVQDDEPVEVEVDDPLGNSDYCSLCRNLGSSIKLKLIDDYFFSLIRKCLPLMHELGFLQKLCEDCMKHLNAFSTFMDKILLTQNPTKILRQADHEGLNIKSYIKVEPIASHEDEEKAIIATSHPCSPDISLTPPKKCEILEIVDIKPFHFDGTLQSYDDEDDIQILSPKQLKVEIDPDDEDGSNELEQIQNFLYISTVFLQDHNYVKLNVKTEYDDDATTKCMPDTSMTLKVCNLCNKSFSSFRKYLMHKFYFHPSTNLEKNQELKRIKNTKRQNYQKIRNICSRIIKYKKKKNEPILQSKRPEAKNLLRRKSYTCPTCNKSFTGPKNLYQHKISHATTFFTCNLCDKRFQRRHGLIQHVKYIHEKEKKHICPICDYRYSLKCDMLKCRHSKLKKLQK